MQLWHYPKIDDGQLALAVKSEVVSVSTYVRQEEHLHKQIKLRLMSSTEFAGFLHAPHSKPIH
jgi:hypothetical protein